MVGVGAAISGSLSGSVTLLGSSTGRMGVGLVGVDLLHLY
jgi:hypothetical protein